MSGTQEPASLERELQRRWHEAHVDRWEKETRPGVRGWRAERLTSHAEEAGGFLEELRRTRDLDAFQSGTDHWMRSFSSGYKGTAGQMIINQIARQAPDREQAVDVLLDALATPADIEDACNKIRRLAAYLESIREGGQPSGKRAPFVASYYWALGQPNRWPAAWPRTAKYLAYVTGGDDFDDQGDRYLELHRFAMEIDGDPVRLEEVAAWWDSDSPVVLDEVLCDRAALREEANKESDDPARYLQNAGALVAVSSYLGPVLKNAVSDAAGRTLAAKKPSPMWTGDWPRGDLWIDWRVPNTYGLGIRLWLNSHGIALGLRPYVDGSAGATGRIQQAIDSARVPGYEMLAGGRSSTGRQVGFVGGGTGEGIYARWIERSDLARLDLREEILRTAHDMAPLMGVLSGDPIVDAEDDDLAEAVAQFKDSTGFPTPSYEQERADQREFAQMLDAEEIELVDRKDLRRIWNSGRYGGTGPMPALNISVRDADEAEYQRIINTFSYICWGDGPPAERIDRVLEDDELRVSGLGESVVMKLLAVTHPDRFLTVYPYGGSQGKVKMLRLLGLPLPDASSRGALQVAANDALRERLDRFFPDDPLGIGNFLYWFVEQPELPETEQDSDPYDELADELLVERGFVEEVVALLEEKKQVVFYGPPGTGKTYFARKLAEMLVPDAERRPIVQFHPSTSYEDFFEGYRPEVDSAGLMSYRLQPGPLAELAARAGDAPGRRHLMIIDEINRANLPKVLGELLFLFEYRDTPVRTLYRPDDPFELPKDIWFIGTMNTADRSIALVDAALRRRFHFIPFFPESGPLEGLLGRWLEREGEPAWIGDLVSFVNTELVRELGGPHLQLGPSHFMTTGLDEAKLRRIWRYDVEPFIEDQFFGDPERVDRFRFDRVMKDFREVAGEGSDDASGPNAGLDVDVRTASGIDGTL